MNKPVPQNNFSSSAQNKGREIFFILFLPLCAAGLLFAPAFFGVAGLFHDDLAMMVFPKYMFLAQSFQKNIFPLWDPFIWCGAQPLFSHYYTELYYIPVWPFWMLADLTSLAYAYRVMVLLPIALHYAVAGSAMVYLLRRRLKCRLISALSGAAVFLFSPMFAYSYSWQQVVYHHAWLVWLLVVYDSLLEKWNLSKAVMGGVVFALLLLAANPGNWHLVFWLWTGWGIVNVLSGADNSLICKRLLRALGSAVFILFVGISLSWVYLYCVLDGYAFVSEHISLSPESVMFESGASAPWVFLLTVFFPDILGTIAGPAVSGLNFLPKLLFWEAGLSGGICVAFCALLGFFAGRKLPDKKQKFFAVFFALLFVFALLCVTGKNSWFYRYVISFIPGIGQLPRPIRYRLLQTFSMAVLCAFGVEVLYVSTTVFVLRLKKMLAVYLVCLCAVFAVVFFYPFGPKESFSRVWTSEIKAIQKTTYGFSHPEWFSESGQALGTFSPPLESERIAVYFDAPAQGEIRLSEKIFPRQLRPGKKVLSYKTNKAGWQIFDVKIPPETNVWICPYGSETARIGLRRFRRSKPSDAYAFNKESGKWQTVIDAELICFEQLVPQTRLSLYERLKGSGPGYNTARAVLLHVFIVTGFLFSACFLSLPKGRILIVGIMIFECMFFCFYAMYQGSYSKGMIFSNHVRSIGPEHPILVRSTESISALSKARPSMRVMCSEPFHDNFGHISRAGFLMGYEMHPLETRFKHAFEQAFGQVLDYDIYYSQPRPESGGWAFMDNFSVAFMVNRSQAAGFRHGESLPLPGSAGYFAHSNDRALPRVYTQSVVVKAEEDKQRDALVSQNLKAQAFVDTSLNLPQMQPMDFDQLQAVNPISELNLENPNSVEININVNHAPVLLVLTDVWFPGWVAVINGRKVPVLRVNYCQRAVLINNQGQHNIKFIFNPASRRTGLWVSVISLMLVLLFFLGKGILWFRVKK